jgi:hypothetical protein
MRPYLRLFTLLYACVALIGCAPTGVVRVDVPEGYKGQLVRIRSGGTPNFFAFLGSGAAHCFIGSIDDRTGADEFLVVPGKHKFQLYVTHMGVEFLGHVDLTVPNFPELTLTAKREGNRFGLVWVRPGSSDAIGASEIESNRLVPLYVPAAPARK